jgi:alkylated DNA repair dioxygenase AlkB
VIRLDLPDSHIEYAPALFAPADADRWFRDLDETVIWRQDQITMFGTTSPVPRLTAWFGDAGCTYTYSRITLQPEPWIEPLLEINEHVERAARAAFNSVLVNLYRDGRDGNAWHSDDEPELGSEPVIASVSLGGTRKFQLRNKADRSMRHDLDLEHGSLLVMRGPTQRCWSHQIPKTARLVEPRINLTFRTIIR